MKKFGKDNCYVGIEYGKYNMVMPITLETANRLMKSQGNKKALMKVKLQKAVARLDELIEILEIRKADPYYVKEIADTLNGPYQPMIGENITVYRNIEPVLGR